MEYIQIPLAWSDWLKWKRTNTFCKWLSNSCHLLLFHVSALSPTLNPCTRFKPASNRHIWSLPVYCSHLQDFDEESQIKYLLYSQSYSIAINNLLWLIFVSSPSTVVTRPPRVPDDNSNSSSGISTLAVSDWNKNRHKSQCGPYWCTNTGISSLPNYVKALNT